MKKTLIASELDDIFDDDDIVYIETELDGVSRHPSNRGSVIIDMGKKIFVPDARYRKKRFAPDTDGYYHKYAFNNTNDNLGQLSRRLYNETHNLRSATEINNKVLEFNRATNRGMSSFELCNNINVPKVGKCVIPTYEQMEIIINYRDQLDALDKSPYNHQNKLFKNWFDSMWSCEFLTCTFVKYRDYRDNYSLEIKSLDCHARYNYSSYSIDINNSNRCLIPIIEL